MPLKATRINSFIEWIKYIYVLGVLIILLRFLFGILQLLRLIVRNGIQKYGSDKLVLVKNLHSPFSFFHLIFIDRHDISDINKTTMLSHERAHVQQLHSIDLLLLEFITMVQWFNPFTWLMRRSLKEIHEFLADDAALKGQYSTLEYQHLLISQAYGLNTYLPANCFNGSLTKKRILMITNNKRNKKWFAAFILIVATIMATNVLTRVSFAQTTPNNKKEKVTRATKNVQVQSNQGKNKQIASPPPTPPKIVNSATSSSASSKSPSIQKDENCDFVTPPLFNGTTDARESNRAFGKFVKENLKYPEELKQLGVNGEVFLLYKIDKTGKTYDITSGNDERREYLNKQLVENKDNPEKALDIKRKLDKISDAPLLLKEAIRIVSALPLYQPAKDKDGNPVSACSNMCNIYFRNPVDQERNESFRDYISRNRIYPEDAKSRGVQGTVYLKYDMDKDGKYGNIVLGNEDMRKYYESKGYTDKIKQITDDPSLVAEAIRLLKSRPGYYIENFDMANRALYGSCSIDFFLD
jgi:hypothetical protein